MIFLSDIPLLLKVASSILFFFSGLLWKKIISGRANYELIIYRTLFSVFFLLIPQIFLFRSDVFFSFSSLFQNGIREWIFSVLICSFSFFGLFFFTKALQEGRFIMVLPLSSLTSVFAVISAFLLFNQVPSVIQIIALIIILISIVIHQFPKLKSFRFDKELILILLSTFFWGVSYTLYLIPINFFGPVNFSLILEITVLISAWLIMVICQKRMLPSKIDNKTLFFCFLIGLCVALGSLFSNISLSEVSVIINVSISLIFEAIVILFSLYSLGEQMNIRDWILIFCVTLASIMIVI